MKILATSDIHNHLPTFDDEEADVLIIAGDLTMFRKKDVWKQANWINKYFHDWAVAMRARFDRILVIAGNHDVVYEDAPNLIDPPTAYTYLQDKEIVIDGVKFWGTPWTKPFFDWGFNAEDDRRQLYFDQIPADTDVIITHGPPRIGNLDVVNNKYNNFTDDFTGDEIMNKTIERVQPKFVFCGHIHEGSGFREYIGKTDVRNVAYVDGHYNPLKVGWSVVEI